jgi:ubiquinone biosynthesis protein Coq4
VTTNLILPADQVEPVARALAGAIGSDDGPTDEQLAVLRALLVHLWQRPDLAAGELAPFEPPAAAEAVTDPAVRRRLNELMVVLEVSRHPQTPAQVARVEEYAHAIGMGGPELEICRDWVNVGVARAMEDFERFYAESLVILSEPSLREKYLRIDEPDLELAAQLDALHALPEGTLGHAFVEFHTRNGLTMPGADIHTPAHYVSHDMNHVIAGYEPTGPGEIALGAFTLAMCDNDANWIQFIANLAIHEAGLVQHGDIQPKAATLSRPGATDLLGEAFHRGAQCTSDFSQAEHLTMVDWPLADVRAHFGVPPADHLGRGM